MTDPFQEMLDAHRAAGRRDAYEAILDHVVRSVVTVPTEAEMRAARDRAMFERAAGAAWIAFAP